MRLVMACLVAVVVSLAAARPVDAQWRASSGIAVQHAGDTFAQPVDVSRSQRITWIDFSSGLLGALIGFVIATTLCDDEPGRSCPAATPAIGGAIGAVIGVAVGRGMRR